MEEITIRDLRNRGGAVIDRVLAGECLRVTRSGRAVAELRPVPRQAMNATTFLDRVRKLPHMDPDALRSDIDAAIDPRL